MSVVELQTAVVDLHDRLIEANSAIGLLCMVIAVQSALLIVVSVRLFVRDFKRSA